MTPNLNVLLWLGSLVGQLEMQSLPSLLSLVVSLILVSIAFNVLWQLFGPKDPSAPPLVFHWIPLFGSAASYGHDPLKFFFECKEIYGDVFTFVLLGRRITVALGPKGNNFVLGGKALSFNAEEAYTHLTTPVFGKDVIFDVPNDVFMEQKKFIKFGLTTENFRAYVGMIEEEVENFMDTDPAFRTWQSGDVKTWDSIDVPKVFSEITILTASRTLQGKEVRGSIDKSFAEVYSDLDGGFTPLNFMFPNLPLESYRKRDRAQKKMSDFYVDIIKRRRTNPQEGAHDMIAALMDKKYRNGIALKDHQIAHLMIALLMAGQHTSAATSTWAFLHLAQSPDTVEDLYQEQASHFRSTDGSWRSPTYEELRNLPILDSVIRETLRIHPPIHSILRKVKDSVIVPGSLASPGHERTYVVPKGHYVLASPLVSQMDPNIWRNANQWQPARWTDPEGVAQLASAQYSDEHGEKVDFGFGAVSKGTESPYQPFGAGRHRCIGEQFAYLQLGTIISTIVRRVELRLDGNFPDHNYHTMITMPTLPARISYRRRV